MTSVAIVSRVVAAWEGKQSRIKVAGPSQTTFLCVCVSICASALRGKSYNEETKISLCLETALGPGSNPQGPPFLLLVVSHQLLGAPELAEVWTGVSSAPSLLCHQRLTLLLHKTLLSEVKNV